MCGNAATSPWEYKRKDKYKSLDEAYRQLYQYRDALDNPPLSVVCDIRTIEIRTHFSGYPTIKTVVKLEEIPGRLELIRRIFVNSREPQARQENRRSHTRPGRGVRQARQPLDRRAT